MRVAEIMTKEVLTVKGDDSLAQAARLICRHHISGLPVVDEEGKLVGIVSEKDILKVVYPSQAEFCEDPGAHMDFEAMEDRYKDMSRVKMEEIMTRRVITVSPDTPVLKAVSTMILKKIRRVPVVEQDRLVGIVSQGDVHQAIFEKTFPLA